MRRLILARLRNAGIARIETERSSKPADGDHPHRQARHRHRQGGRLAWTSCATSSRGASATACASPSRRSSSPSSTRQLVAENIASQIERRITYSRAMKQAILRTHARRRQGREDPGAAAASAAPRWRAASGTAKAACPCTRCAPTSTSAGLPLAPRSAPSASSAGSTRATHRDRRADRPGGSSRRPRRSPTGDRAAAARASPRRPPRPRRLHAEAGRGSPESARDEAQARAACATDDRRDGGRGRRPSPRRAARSRGRRRSALRRAPDEPAARQGEGQGRSASPRPVPRKPATRRAPPKRGRARC